MSVLPSKGGMRPLQTPNAEQARKAMEALGDPEKAAILRRFFKTGPGEYGEGDLFRGITVPLTRKVAREYRHLPLQEAEILLGSGFHEDRLLALLILVGRFLRSNEAERSAIHALYLSRTRFINNWDLVDLSAEHIVGAHLVEKSKEPLTRLAGSNSLWERRIAVMATFHYIRRGSFDETLRIARILLDDTEDLIHKATGWMLREIGKRDIRAEEDFLLIHYRRMPRTMLRYAIERFPETRRKAYLKGEIGTSSLQEREESIDANS